MQKNNKVRLAAFLALVGIFFAVRQWTPVGEFMTVEYLRALIEPLGFWGAVLFVGFFCLGTVVQIPGILFYSASFMIFGSILGGLIAYIGSVLAVTLSFYFARQMGGSALSGIQNKRMQSMLLRLEQQPVLIIGVLRTFMWVSPPLNYALAFSSIPSRKYIAGSIVGLTVPALAMACTTCFF